MTLNEAVQAIFTKFSSEDLFDSHTVIKELITNPNYHFAYLKEYPEKCTVNQYHAQIAKMIGRFDCVQSFGRKIKTHTIYGDILEN